MILTFIFYSTVLMPRAVALVVPAEKTTFFLLLDKANSLLLMALHRQSGRMYLGDLLEEF